MMDYPDLQKTSYLARCLKSPAKTLSFSFLLKVTVSWTFNVFRRRQTQGGPREQRQHPAVGVVTYLGGVSVPFVTSQRAGLGRQDGVFYFPGRFLTS